MLAQFEAFVAAHQLAKGTTLLGVSGGVDSMSMLHLYHAAGLKIAVAHCHFGLRGADADADQQLVEQTAKHLGIACYTRQFNTKAIATNRGISIQMAARDLRFEWFTELAQTHGFESIAVATHLDDQLETLLLNQLRGTGIAGLHGILPKRDTIVRPLLFATRAAIEAYAKANQITWREDASNRSLDYDRNRIRLKVTPALREINPRVTETFAENAARLNATEQIYRATIDQKRQALFEPIDTGFRIAIEPLKALEPNQHWVYELFAPWGFSGVVIHDLCSNWNRQPGARFESANHVITFDRDVLLLTPIVEKATNRVLLKETDSQLTQPVHLQLSQHSAAGFALPRDAQSAALDVDRLQFPLTVRAWQPGDRFVPLGMTQHKKVSDYLVDTKVPVTAKNQTYVLESAGKIAWLIGHRIDDRFKIGEATQNIYLAQLIATNG